MLLLQHMKNQNDHFIGYKIMIRVATRMTENLKSRFKENLTMLIIIMLISVMTVFAT
jgi:hypothetical protein